MQILEHGVAKTLLREVLREPLGHFRIGKVTCGFASHCELQLSKIGRDTREFTIAHKT
jgi:hypothetical protein